MQVTRTTAAFISGLLLIGITLLVVSNVILRIFNESILCTYEAVEIMIVIPVAFGIVYCASKGRQIAVTLLVSRLPQSIRVIFAIITGFVGIGIWALIAWKSAELATEIKDVSFLMHWPVYPFRYAFVLALIALCFVLLLDLYNNFRRVLKK